MTNRTEPFTLDILAPHLKNFTPPQGSFDPESLWQQSYHVYTLSGRGGRVGILNLHRKNLPEKIFILEVQYVKNIPKQHSQTVTARIICRPDEIATPTSWIYSTKIQDRLGKLVPYTAIKKSASVKGKTIEVQDGKSRRQIPIPKTYTINWTLFDVVQRLPREKDKSLSFTLLDHFDQTKPNQTLAYHGSREITINNTELLLHRFDQLGEGIVPWVYWVDKAGRLLFVVSGLEAYILDAFK